MWFLYLNDMRSSKIENLQLVAYATTKQKLIEFVQKHRVENYRDERWGKCFSRGSVLEWYNAPFNEQEHFVEYDFETHLQKIRNEYNSILMNKINAHNY